MPLCPACDTSMRSESNGRHRCPNCGHRTSGLILDFDRASPLDDEALKHAISAQRRREHEELLDWLGITQRGLEVLDVGCATGEFLEVCRQRGLEVTGVEPDPRLARISKARGFTVEECLFEDLPSHHEGFDLIVFNDVLEHVPEPGLALEHARSLLRPSGRVAVTLPSASGVFYRVATFAERWGRTAPMQRLWQAEYPSPHLHYFTPLSLRTMARSQGLRELDANARVPVARSGLWERIRADRSAGIAYSSLVWAGVMLALPALERLPRDISVQVFVDADPSQNRGTSPA